MHSSNTRTLVLFVCALALGLSGLVPPVAADTTQITEPIDFIATACNGETVTLTGEATTIVTVGEDGSGGRAVTTHIHFHLEGTSASGTHYIANETVNGVDVGAGGSPSTFNSVGQLHLISQGGGSDLTVRTTIHTTIDANGNITAQSFEFETVCTG